MLDIFYAWNIQKYTICAINKKTETTYQLKIVYDAKALNLPNIVHLLDKLCSIYRKLKRCTYQTNND